jgi:hypothetical protein
MTSSLHSIPFSNYTELNLESTTTGSLKIPVKILQLNTLMIHCFKFSIVLQHSFSISTILKTLMKKVLNLKLMGILHVSSRHLHHPSKFLNLNELSSVKKSKSNVSGYLVVLW